MAMNVFIQKHRLHCSAGVAEPLLELFERVAALSLEVLERAPLRVSPLFATVVYFGRQKQRHVPISDPTTKLWAANIMVQICSHAVGIIKFVPIQPWRPDQIHRFPCSFLTLTYEPINLHWRSFGFTHSFGSNIQDSMTVSSNASHRG
jgi:hypothetical protein